MTTKFIDLIDAIDTTTSATTHVPAKLSRRSLALGGPAALAVGALGQAGVLGVLGAAHTNAQAAVTLTDSAFYIWYRAYFLPFARRAAAYSLYETKRTYHPKDLLASKTKFIEVWNTLSTTEQSQVITRKRGYYSVATGSLPGWLRTVGEPQRPPVADIAAYITWILSKTDEQFNVFKQVNNHGWHMIYGFMQSAASSAQKTLLSTLSLHAEKTDDNARRLGAWWGSNTTDRVEVELDSTKNPVQKVKMGNLRGAVERRDLYTPNNWLQSMLNGYEYDEVSIYLNGTDGLINTKGQPVVDRILNNGTLFYESAGNTSNPDYGVAPAVANTYTLSPSVNAAISVYIDDDITQNGPFENMTNSQSVQGLTNLTGHLYSKSGMVYESYVAAQYLMRFFAQANIALIRFHLGKVIAPIDIEALAKSIEEIARQDMHLQLVTEAQRLALLVELSTLTGFIVTGLVFTGFGLKNAKYVVRTNTLAGLNTTEAADLARVKDRITLSIASAVTQTVAQMGAIGLLTKVAIKVETSQADKIRWIAPGFIFADLAGGLNDYVRIFRKYARGYGSIVPSDVTILMAATSRIFSGLYPIPSVLKKFGWKIRLGTTWTPPLLVTGWAASASSILYMISTVLLYVNM